MHKIDYAELDTDSTTTTTTTTTSTSSDKDDFGIGFGIWTGLKFHATQYVAPFFDIGFHYSVFFADMKDNKIFGYNVMIGVSFTIGRNRDISSGY